MILALVLLLSGLCLSAFFSGSETGLYRVSRTRLVLDGLSGSLAGRGLVRLINQPAIFVATTLVGNNLANYLTSAAVVLFIATALGGGPSAELLGTVLMTPVVFVFGELLPKHWFYQAPYRLVRATRWGLLTATVLFSPISLVLGILGRFLQSVTGQTPFRLRLAMARGDLEKVVRAGHEAGILAAGQRDLTQNLFEIGNRLAIIYGVPPDRLATVELDRNGSIDIRAARRRALRVNHPIILVKSNDQVVGYVRFADLQADNTANAILDVVACRTSDRHLNVLLKLYDAHSDVALLLDDNNRLRTVVTRRQLLQPLLN
ncbi:MAG: DUF21 domain-containing protein [Planctomycetota bacterium]